ncbi:MAG TPA: flagellar hook-basal body complex protein FliE [Geminicoccaceae bacterium]|nr:flagellar hook-basal body complex protein FliE [Geminicoccaceae bacterium]
MASPTVNLSPVLARFAQAIDATPRSGGGPPPAAFGAVLDQVLAEGMAAGRKGEVAATQAVAGHASLQEVVEAVNAAELTLQTVVAVRDRMITAYQDIIRMPI